MTPTHLFPKRPACGPLRRPTLMLVATLLLGAGSTSGEAQLESMALTNDATSAVLALGLSRDSRWLAGSRADGLITVTLEDVTPGPTITNMLDPEGLVASVEVFPGRPGEAPTTRIQIRTRAKCTYSVATTKSGLFVRLWSSGTAPPATPPQAARGVGSTTEPASGEYRIGAGDVVQVEVFGLPELTRETRVLRDGSITLPLIGAVRVAGLDLRQAEQGIAALLTQRQLVNEPQVSILVKELQSRGVSIQGAVAKPGVYQMVESRSLLEMIGQAGGLLAGARPGTSIIILRDRDGTQERIEIDALRLVEQGDLSLNMPLYPGDIVMVPPPRVYRAFISGAVQRTGTVEFSSAEPFTAFQAITASGGPTERANLRKVTVIRRAADGSQQRIDLNLKKVRKGSAEDVLLVDGDTIVVGEWFF